MKRVSLLWIILISLSILCPFGFSAERSFGEYDALVPRYLLSLVHASETQVELQLTPDQIVSLESLFRETDAKWFPSRLLPADKQLLVLQELEGEVIDWFQKNATKEQRSRLRQLEFYAQGNRFLLRDDVAKELQLPPKQRAKLAEAAKATSDMQRKMGKVLTGSNEAKKLQATIEEHLKSEQDVASKILTSEQRAKLSKLLGDEFNPSQLKRIWAMAPDFVDVDNWINSSPLRMSELRGKVLLIHFYAFQCSNCHANFNIYKRWHKELVDKGVVVIGIQSPETNTERDPQAVRAAAAEKGLHFPIVVDLAMGNWDAWGNTMWPTVYVVDKKGYIRHWWQGELNWQGATEDKTIERIVDELLNEEE